MTTRRSFLTMLGLSPVVAAVPAVAAKEIAPFESLSKDVREYLVGVSDDMSLIAGRIASPSGDFEVDLNNGRMSWYSDDDDDYDVSDYDPEPFDPRDDEYEYDDWSHDPYDPYDDWSH